LVRPAQCFEAHASKTVRTPAEYPRSLQVDCTIGHLRPVVVQRHGVVDKEIREKCRLWTNGRSFNIRGEHQENRDGLVRRHIYSSLITETIQSHAPQTKCPEYYAASSRVTSTLRCPI